MENKIGKEVILAVIGLISLCSGSTLILIFFPIDLFLWPGYRDLNPNDKPGFWIIGALLLIVGFIIFMYLWRDIVSFKPDRDAKRKKN